MCRLDVAMKVHRIDCECAGAHFWGSVNLDLTMTRLRNERGGLR
jgi:aspartate 1-decarboxylase